MASLNMGSYYPLNQETIDSVILPNRPGNYAYGYIKENGAFGVRYVGRSDTDLLERISHGIAENVDNPSLKYEQFKFSYANSPREAYEKECCNYHDFGGEQGRLDNKVHPDKPEGEDIKCPICGK